jgi:hypothetical protein
VEAFKNVCFQNEDSPVSSPHTGGMGFLEKVKNWAFIVPDDMEPPAVEDEEGSFDGAEEKGSFGEAEEEELLPEILAYREIIEGSSAYHLLLAQLRCTMLLSATKPDICAEIRNSILFIVPPPRQVSRSRPTDLVHAIFDVDWDPIAFLEEQQYEEELGHGLETTITLTGCVQESQAVTCAYYLEQTWPLMSKPMLQVLKRAIQTGAGVRHIGNKKLARFL